MELCVSPLVSHLHGIWTYSDYDTEGRQPSLLVPVPLCPILTGFGHVEYYDTEGRQTSLLVPVPQRPILVGFGHIETTTQRADSRFYFLQPFLLSTLCPILMGFRGRQTSLFVFVPLCPIPMGTGHSVTTKCGADKHLYLYLSHSVPLP